MFSLVVIDLVQTACLMKKFLQEVTEKLLVQCFILISFQATCISGLK